MIKKPEDMDFSGQHFSMIIYGSPGLGKTTLAHIIATELGTQIKIISVRYMLIVQR